MTMCTPQLAQVHTHNTKSADGIVCITRVFCGFVARGARMKHRGAEVRTLSAAGMHDSSNPMLMEAYLYGRLQRECTPLLPTHSKAVSAPPVELCRGFSLCMHEA
jgi:hypothetical protein